MLFASLILTDPVDLFAHGAQAGARRAETGQKSDDSQHNYNPYAEVKPILEINAQHQKHAGGK